MQEGHEENNRDELQEPLRGLETPPSANTLAELSYRRAREALERALEEARTVRLAALEDARATRERELTALLASLRSLRQAAESEVAAIIARAELEASQTRDQTRRDADELLAKSEGEAALLRANADAMRLAAEARAREVDTLEADFNSRLSEMAERIGLTEQQPSGGWLRSLFGGNNK
jgi:hypothetical protein